MGRQDYSGDDEERRTRKKRSKREREKDDSNRNCDPNLSKSYHRSDDRKKKRRRNYSDSDETSSSVDSRRRQKKHKKKKHKKSDKKIRRDREPPTDDDGALRRNYVFADALHHLLEEHPALSADLPIMLIRMAGGASFDLSQMSDAGAAHGLGCVFRSLQTFGVELEGNSWKWKPPLVGGGGRETELLLVRISRTLLDQIGLTMDSVESYGRVPRPVVKETIPAQVDKAVEFTPLQTQTFSLIDRFRLNDVTLPNQLGDLCNIILSGESVALDGIPDENLRDSLEKLLRGAGLTQSEMDDDDNDDDEEEETTMGYGLPEGNDHFARANMEYILAACKHRAAVKPDEAPRRVLRGPLPQHMTSEYISHTVPDDDDDDEDGPVPADMHKTRKVPSKEAVQAMAELRKQELEGLVSNHAVASKPGEREEWMINPGEHDLLQGIKSGGMKNRNFENKKTAATELPEATMDPSMQAEVDAIIQAHKDARGPTLMDQHRAKAAAEKAAKENNSNASFGWSREKDLDAGRRVDKEALRLLMGGASGGLNDKFQGGFNKE